MNHVCSPADGRSQGTFNSVCIQGRINFKISRLRGTSAAAASIHLAENIRRYDSIHHVTVVISL